MVVFYFRLQRDVRPVLSAQEMSDIYVSTMYAGVSDLGTLIPLKLPIR